MRKLIRTVAIIVVLGLLVGCGISKGAISETVKGSMQNTFNTDSDFQDYNLHVESVQVLKKSDNSYKGLAIVAYKGKSHDVTLDITVDGRNVMWEAAPGSFLFIAKSELEDFLNIYK